MSRAKIQTQALSGQRGQAAVLSALCLFTMVVFLAMATNTGILVNDRIRMQNTADLTAYAGAFEQARSMNEMATVNRQIFKHVQRIRGVLNYGPSFLTDDPPDSTDIFYWKQPPCSCLPYSPWAQAYIKFAQATINAEAPSVSILNLKGQATARAAATATASRNFLGIMSGPRHLSFFQRVSGSPNELPGLMELERVENTAVGYNYIRSCRCCDGCCKYPQIRTEELTTWFYKSNPELVYFPARVNGVPLKNLLDYGRRGKRMFGADADNNPAASDMLWGYAAAKPYEGMVGTSNPGNSNPGTMVPMNPVYPPNFDILDFFRPSYRARIAGIHENMSGSAVQGSMAQLIQSDSAEPKWKNMTDYFAH